MRVAVTGAQGYVARYVLPHLEGVDTLLIDRVLGSDCRHDETRQQIAAFNPNYIVHLAAEHMTDWCESHRDETIDVNVNGLARVLDAAYESRALEGVVIASSAAVYGYGELAFSETALPMPVGVYGASKLLNERELQTFSVQRPTIRCTAARLFSVIGPGDRNDHLLPKIMRGADRVPEAVRDYVHAADVAHALLLAAINAPVGMNVYNVCTGVPTSTTQLLRLVGSTATTGARTGRCVGRPDRIQHDLGWRARFTVEDAIRHMRVKP